MKLAIVFVVLFGVNFLSICCDALRCNTDEGPSPEDVKKIIRICMKRMGLEISDNNDSSNSSSDEDDNDNGDNPMMNRNDVHKQSNGNNRNRGSNLRGGADNYRQPQQWNQSHNNSNSDNRLNDRSCLMNCFFQEMKMTNEEGFPEKHKVLQGITKNIKNRDLKDFYVDTIQECFHVLGMDERPEKCEYSKILVTCMTESAKVNCEDFRQQSPIF